MLSLSDRRSISRQCGAGIPAEQIAKDYGIKAAHVLRIDMAERDKAAVRNRVAEPSYQPPKPKDWKSARPPEDRVRRGEPCRTPECSGVVERGSYCSECAGRLYAPQRAA